MPRHSLAARAAVALSLSFSSFVGCGGSVETVTCGANTVSLDGVCIGTPPADVDAGPVDGANRCGTPPAFHGVVDVSPGGPTRLQVSWDPATDAFTPSDRIRYRVYLATKEAGEDFTSPVVETAPGTTHLQLDDLRPAGSTWYVVVRAVDECGQADGNSVEKRAAAVDDNSAPTFGGIASATTATERGGAVKVTWDPAVDDLTSPAGLVYLVYASTNESDVFTVTPVLSEPGATSLVVGGLTDASKNYVFAVRARDAAGNIDHNKITKTTRPSPDTRAPVFGGCSDASQKDATSIVVTWRPPTDDVASIDGMTIVAYVGEGPRTEDFSKPIAKFRAGATTGLLTGLRPKTEYAIICRAVDAAGNQDMNVVEVSASTGIDTIPPTFLGLGRVASVDPTKVTLSWEAALDDQTAPSGITYAAYVGNAAVDYTKPWGTTAAGVTTLDVGGLLESHDYVFAVRAIDASGNQETNTVVRSFRTSPGFGSIQAIFDLHCATAGCHVVGSTSIPLVPGASYKQLVGVPSIELPTLLRVAAGDSAKSYLYWKLTGAPSMTGALMPPPGTTGVGPLGSVELATIKAWIDLGATDK